MVISLVPGFVVAEPVLPAAKVFQYEVEYPVNR